MPDVTVNVDAVVTAVEVEETNVTVEVIGENGSGTTLEVMREEVAFVEVLVPGPPGPTGPSGSGPGGEPDVPSLVVFFENQLV